MRRFFAWLLALALVWGQSAANAHALTHALFDLDVAGQARVSGSPAQAHEHIPGMLVVQADEADARLPHLDHGRNRCASFASLGACAGAPVPFALAQDAIPDPGPQAGWHYLAVRFRPFTARAPPPFAP